MESDHWIGSNQWPEGACCRTQQNNGTANWYVRQYNGVVPINLCDIPKEIKTLMLLMGEQL